MGLFDRMRVKEWDGPTINALAIPTTSPTVAASSCEQLSLTLAKAEVRRDDLLAQKAKVEGELAELEPVIAALSTAQASLSDMDIGEALFSTFGEFEND